MPIPDAIRQTVEARLAAYVGGRIPAHARDKVRLSFSVRGNSVTLVEQRPAFLNPAVWVDIKVAQFRFDPEDGKWALYCADRNSKWREYYDLVPNEDFGILLQEVEDDPTGIFWG